MSREHARTIWNAAVDAVRPERLLSPESVGAAIGDAPRVIVMGAGKAGAAMSVALEAALGERIAAGWVNIPEGTEKPTRRIHLHAARPPASNHPTDAGVRGSREILRLAREAGKDDVGVCLLSGGGSALLPAPADGITLADKQAVTKLLHACGATINEMNAVRKHLSAIKGGRLAEAFAGRRLVSLIISDVIGDPLDVIASGPTAPDPTTFADCAAIFEKYDLLSRVPADVRRRIDSGMIGTITETPKSLPARVENRVIGNCDVALAAAAKAAASLGYRTENLGSAIDGDTGDRARDMMAIFSAPGDRPTCVLSGGETTVRLPAQHGKGGRNQEFVLTLVAEMDPEKWRNAVVLSGGTDGEDGPTDAAGALADAGTLQRARARGLDARDFLDRHDAYEFFRQTGDLLVSGPTDTNVMDVRVLLREGREARRPKPPASSGIVSSG